MKWCDLSCKHAVFPKTWGLQGACNTMQALFCSKHKRPVAKNAPCLDDHAKLKKK